MPTLNQKPTKVATSASSITINWNEPVDNGGCSILGYSVYIDDGSNGDYKEANYINDASVRLHPSLSTLEITTLALVNLGKTFRILVRAYNWAGSADSPILGVVYATLPL